MLIYSVIDKSTSFICKKIEIQENLQVCFVFSEEVFSSNKALWFSPDGKKLAYGRFDDTDVPIMVIPIYGEPGKISSQYPRANFIKYPKVSIK